MAFLSSWNVAGVLQSSTDKTKNSKCPKFCFEERYTRALIFLTRIWWNISSRSSFEKTVAFFQTVKHLIRSESWSIISSIYLARSSVVIDFTLWPLPFDKRECSTKWRPAVTFLLLLSMFVLCSLMATSLEKKESREGPVWKHSTVQCHDWLIHFAGRWNSNR